MTAGQWFWIIYVIIFVFAGWWGFNQPDRRYGFGSVVLMVLIGLLGWGVFGSPLK